MIAALRQPAPCWCPAHRSRRHGAADDVEPGSAPQRFTPDYIHALAGLSRTHEFPYVVHVLEKKL